MDDVLWEGFGPLLCAFFCGFGLMGFGLMGFGFLGLWAFSCESIPDFDRRSYFRTRKRQLGDRLGINWETEKLVKSSKQARRFLVFVFFVFCFALLCFSFLV